MKKLYFFYSYFIFVTGIISTSSSQIVPDFQVSDIKVVERSLKDHPAIAIAPNGNYLIVWNYNKYSDRNYDIFARIYTKSGNAIGNYFRVNDDIGNSDHRYPLVTVNSIGNFIIAWDDNRNKKHDFYMQMYSESGTPIGHNIKISKEIDSQKLARGSIMVKRDDSFLATWQKDQAVYGQYFLKNGTRKGSNFQIITLKQNEYYHSICAQDSNSLTIAVQKCNDYTCEPYLLKYILPEKKLVKSVKVNDDIEYLTLYFDVATDKSGNLICTYSSPMDRRAKNIYARKYNNSLEPLSNSLIINDTTNADKGQPRITIDDQGQIVIVWVDAKHAREKIYAQILSNELIPINKNFELTDSCRTINDQQSPSIASDSTGNFTIVWAEGNYESIWGQRYGKSGNKNGNNFLVNNDEVSFKYGHGTAKISVNNEGYFAIAWIGKTNFNSNIYAKIYTDEVKVLKNSFKVNDDIGYAYQGDVSISNIINSNFVITWTDKRDGNLDIYAQKFTNLYDPIRNNFKINSDLNNTIQNASDVAIDYSGSFIVSWFDLQNGEWDIYAQRFDYLCNPIGEALKVNDRSQGYQTYSKVAVDSAGNFVFVWGEYQDGYVNIYAQWYGNNGEPIGNTIRVNEIPGVRYLTITKYIYDHFVVSWTVYRNRKYSIYAQIFSSDGNRIGANFQVNEDNEYSHRNSSVSINDKNDFIIVWEKDTEDYYTMRDIYAQKYAAGGLKIDNNFRITITCDKDQYGKDVKVIKDKIYTTWCEYDRSIPGTSVWANILNWNDIASVKHDNYSEITSNYILNQNYPNPFNSSTIISYDLQRPGKISIKIYNVKGQLIETLFEGFKFSGKHLISWNALNRSSGIYLYKIQVGSSVKAGKMIYIK